mgnify:FL=1
MESQRDFVTDGLVVREYELGEHDKMLTLLTPAYGRIPVIAKGARSLRNKYMTPARLFTYANYELHRRGDMTWLRSAEIIEPFPQLEREITRLYLAQYLADLACELSGEGEPAVDILRLTLNSLYAVCRGVKDQRLIKGTFEWRAAGYSGYLPELGDCHVCGAVDARSKDDGGICYLDVMNGALMCASCAACRMERDSALPPGAIPVDDDGVRSILLPLDRAVIAAIKYVLEALPERMFAFSLSNEADFDTFSSAGSTYITHHLERGFASLALYNEIMNM